MILKGACISQNKYFWIFWHFVWLREGDQWKRLTNCTGPKMVKLNVLITVRKKGQKVTAKKQVFPLCTLEWTFSTVYVYLCGYWLYWLPSCLLHLIYKMHHLTDWRRLQTVRIQGYSKFIQLHCGIWTKLSWVQHYL